MHDDDLDAAIKHGTALAGIAVDPAWRAAISPSSGARPRAASIIRGSWPANTSTVPTNRA